jgi:light-regulated signal transduction histidine kinase (bacteriophytochrome)
MSVEIALACVGNAWKFTSHQDDALIELGTTPTGDAQVCYYVRDNGAGLEPIDASKLVEPFQRLHPASEFPGTSIGLASVRQIVERHAGARGPRAS